MDRGVVRFYDVIYAKKNIRFYIRITFFKLSCIASKVFNCVERKISVKILHLFALEKASKNLIRPQKISGTFSQLVSRNFLFARFICWRLELRNLLLYYYIFLHLFRKILSFLDLLHILLHNLIFLLLHHFAFLFLFLWFF